jgi:hypothetical protein
MAQTTTVTCISCKRLHSLLLADGGTPLYSKTYEFTCPKTKEIVHLFADHWMAVQGSPSDLVEVREVP